MAVMPSLPNDEAIVCLVGALMLETNDEWAVARRYMSLETLARVHKYRQTCCRPFHYLHLRLIILLCARPLFSGCWAQSL